MARGRVATGKEPIGSAWGAEQWTAEKAADAYKRFRDAGVGICLGPGRAPGGGWLIDVEGDGPGAEGSRERLYGGEVVETVGWGSARGGHQLLEVDPARIMALLPRLKSWEAKGANQAGVYKSPAELPGLELRIGGYKPDGETVKQVQSVAPPTPGTDGVRREWNGPAVVARAPESFYATLEALAPAAPIAPTATLPAPSPAQPGGRWTPEMRAIRYLDACDPAISGQAGHNKTFGVACRVGPGFDLDPSTTIRLLMEHYNPRCEPPWSEAEIRHKVEDAYANEKERGFLRDADRGRGGRPRPEATPPALNVVRAEEDAPRERPTIVLDQANMHAVVDLADEALEGDDELYSRGPFLVRIVPFLGKTKRHQPGRMEGAPVVAIVESPTLAERLSRVASFAKVSRTRNGDEVLTPTMPPPWVVSALLARKAWAKVRHLAGVVESPTIRPDGSVLDRPGWDPETALLYRPNAEFLPVPEVPTLEDARQAAKILFDLVDDFPFADERHRAVWLSALLTLAARGAIDGAVPMTLFDANTPGSGKSKLAHLIAVIVIGRAMATTTYPATNEEMDKLLTSVALANDPYILFDNIPNGGAVGCASLDKAITSTTIKGRLLGRNEAPTLPWSAVILASGNNMEMAADALRRINHCRLESRYERPEERTDFRLTPSCPCGCGGSILAHARNNRAELLRATLTILRAHAVAGRPAPEGLKPIDFPEWSRVIRNAVAWATGVDPCATREDAIASDKATSERAAVVAGWRRLCAMEGKMKMSAAEALAILEAKPNAHPDLHEVLITWTRDGKLPSPRVVGNKFGAIKGRMTAAGRLEFSTLNGNRIWYVELPPSGSVTQSDSLPSYAGEKCTDSCHTKMGNGGAEKNHFEPLNHLGGREVGEL